MKEVVDESDSSEQMVNDMGDGEKVPADKLREVLRNLWEEDPDKVSQGLTAARHPILLCADGGHQEKAGREGLLIGL